MISPVHPQTPHELYAFVHLALEVEQPQCPQLNRSTRLQVISHHNWQVLKLLNTLCNPVYNST